MHLPALERELERQNRIAVMKPLYAEAERLVDAALAAWGDRLPCCYAWPVSVGDWLRARTAVVDARLKRVGAGLGRSGASCVLRQSADGPAVGGSR